MSLPELHRRLRELEPVCTPGRSRLRRVLAASPRFLIVDPWTGPWLPDPDEPSPTDEGVLVLALDRGSTTEDPVPASTRLRESVRWIAKGADLRSPSEVARLYVLLLEEEEARAQLTEKAA